MEGCDPSIAVMKIAIIYSLPTRRALTTPYKATDEDTKDSAIEVSRALKEKGATIEILGIDEDSIEKIRSIHADVLFNIIEWDGFDTPLSVRALGLIESLHIPYTGPAVEAIEVCNDKVKMKKLLDVHGLPTPLWQLFTTGTEPIRDHLRFPVIVKLAWEHCSVGLTQDAIVQKKDDLAAAVKERIATFHQPVYVEEFIDGREFQVTILDGSKGLRVLPPAEIVFDTKGTGAFLTYESRWNEEHPEYETSHVVRATLSPVRMQQLYRLAHKTFRMFGFRDYCRLDIRLSDDTFYILEANANPGLGDSDDYGMTVSYKAAGMTFADFCWEIVESCLRRKRV